MDKRAEMTQAFMLRLLFLFLLGGLVTGEWQAAIVFLLLMVVIIKRFDQIWSWAEAVLSKMFPRDFEK